MEIQRLPHGYVARTDGGVVVRFRNLYQEKNAISCAVHAYRTIPEKANILITNLNLMAPRSVLDVAKTLNAQDGSVDWTVAFPALVAEILNDYITPQVPEELSPASEMSPSWVVKGFLPSESPTILFAPGGSGKSFLALFVALCVQNGVSFLAECDKAKTLYLDWEVDKKEANRRLGMLYRGLIDVVEVKEYPHYLRMYLPLADCLDHVLEVATERGYRLLIIDSAACAVGGDMNDSAVVTKFFGVIRRINACGITTLILSHVSKADKMGDSRRSPIGSVHFENFPRVAWELRSEYDGEKKEYRLGLFCRKSNLGSLEPIGVKMEFVGDAVVVSRTEADLLEGTGGRDVTVTSAILAVLEERPMTAKEISEELRVPPSTVYPLITRLKKAGKIEGTGYGNKVRLVKSEKEEAPF